MNLSSFLIAAALFASSSAMPEMAGFAPLHCNIDASIDSDECLANAVGFSTLFSEDESAPLTIPCGKCVVMDYTDGSTITVSGGLNVIGRLHFPPTASVTLRTTAVYVQGGWSMGIPEEGNTVKVSLYGNEEKTFYPHTSCCENNDIDNVYGYDCTCSMAEPIGKLPFVVAGGQLDIRAIDDSCPSWTKLNEVISLETLKVDPAFASCLRPGDELLVTSDQRKFGGHETIIVDSVDKSTGEVVLETAMPRVFPAEVGDGEPEFAAEVALLRRDVIFTAESDPSEDWIGGHSIIYHTPHVVQTIQGVHFDNFGQEGNLGRYPIHFHMSGSTASLVSKNLITNSNQRCIIIHNTNDVTIDDNVSFDTFGHCYATETGSEEHNTFTHNLGAYTKKLTRKNGQSDSPGVTGGQTAIFWIRNMKNTFVGNVAAGSAGSGFWLEMKNKYGEQLNEDSFMDNSAHSSYRGLVTYKHGWKPKTPGVMKNFKSYNNSEGAKFHITKLIMKNALFADNWIGVRHGVWNAGITIENSKFIGLSKDQELRMGKSCPPSGGHGIRASYNGKPWNYGGLILKDVEFSNFICNSRSYSYYNDHRMAAYMSDPMQAENVSFVNTSDKNRPRLTGCTSFAVQMWHQEDFDGTLTPSANGPGFLVHDKPATTAFIPEGSCESLPDFDSCTTFCKEVCLRIVHLKATGSVTHSNTDIQKVQLTNPTTGVSQSYDIDKWGRAAVLLPSGQYNGEFLDSAGNSVAHDTVEIRAFRKPRCSGYVTEADISFTSTSV